MEYSVPTLEQIASILNCPECGSAMHWGTSMVCLGCGQPVLSHLGIPVMQPKPKHVLEAFSQYDNPVKDIEQPKLSLIARIMDRVQRLFGNTLFWPHMISNRKGRQALERLLAGAQGVTVEVGCGEHTAARYLKGMVSYIPTDYIGWDELVDMNRTWNGGLLAHRREKKPLIWADSLALPFRDNSLDSWIAIEMLEHVPYPEKALTEVARVLKSGGKAFISVPWLLRVHGGDNDEGDFGRYTKLKFETMAGDSGLRVTDFFCNTSVWTTIEFMFTGYLIRLIMEKVPTKGLKLVCGILLCPAFFLFNLFAWLFDGQGDRRFAFRYYVVLQK